MQSWDVEPWPGGLATSCLLSEVWLGIRMASLWLGNQVLQGLELAINSLHPQWDVLCEEHVSLQPRKSISNAHRESVLGPPLGREHQAAFKSCLEGKLPVMLLVRALSHLA